jgi:hypothetical protein
VHQIRRDESWKRLPFVCRWCASASSGLELDRASTEARRTPTSKKYLKNIESGDNVNIDCNDNNTNDGDNDKDTMADLSTYNTLHIVRSKATMHAV